MSSNPNRPLRRINIASRSIPARNANNESANFRKFFGKKGQDDKNTECSSIVTNEQMIGFITWYNPNHYPSSYKVPIHQ